MNSTTEKSLDQLAVGDDLVITARVKDKLLQDDTMVLNCDITNSVGKTVLTGLLKVLQPQESVQLSAVTLPHAVAQHNRRN